MRPRWFDRRPLVRAVMALAGPRPGIRFANWCDTDPVACWFRDWVVLAITRPRLWWLSRRILLSIRWGLPMPRTDIERGRFRA